MISPADRAARRNSDTIEDGSNRSTGGYERRGAREPVRGRPTLEAGNADTFVVPAIIPPVRDRECSNHECSDADHLCSREQRGGARTFTHTHPVDEREQDDGRNADEKLAPHQPHGFAEVQSENARDRRDHSGLHCAQR